MIKQQSTKLTQTFRAAPLLVCTLVISLLFGSLVLWYYSSKYSSDLSILQGIDNHLWQVAPASVTVSAAPYTITYMGVSGTLELGYDQNNLLTQFEFSFAKSDSNNFHMLYGISKDTGLDPMLDARGNQYWDIQQQDLRFLIVILESEKTSEELTLYVSCEKI